MAEECPRAYPPTEPINLMGHNRKSLNNMVEKKRSLQQQKWVPMLAHGSVIVGYNAFRKGACSRGSRTDLLPVGDGSQVMRMHGMTRLLVLAQGRLFLLRSQWRFMQKARPGPIKGWAWT